MKFLGPKSSPGICVLWAAQTGVANFHILTEVNRGKPVNPVNTTEVNRGKPVNTLVVNPVNPVNTTEVNPVNTSGKVR